MRVSRLKRSAAPSLVTSEGSITLIAHRTLMRPGGAGGQSQGMVVSPDGSTLYLINEGAHLEAWDLASGAITENGLAGVVAQGLGASPDGEWLYLAEWGAGRMNIVDSWTLQSVATIDTGGFPRSLAVSADGSTIVINNEDGRVQTIH